MGRTAAGWWGDFNNDFTASSFNKNEVFHCKCVWKALACNVLLCCRGILMLEVLHKELAWPDCTVLSVHRGRRPQLWFYELHACSALDDSSAAGCVQQAWFTPPVMHSERPTLDYLLSFHSSFQAEEWGMLVGMGEGGASSLVGKAVRCKNKWRIVVISWGHWNWDSSGQCRLFPPTRSNVLSWLW